MELRESSQGGRSWCVTVFFSDDHILIRRYSLKAFFLCRKWRDAKANAAEQRMEFDAQNAALSPATRAEWEDMVEKWEKNPALQDPYINEHSGKVFRLQHI